MLVLNVEPFIRTRQWEWPRERNRKLGHSLDGPTFIFSYTSTRSCVLPSMTIGHHILDSLGLLCNK